MRIFRPILAGATLRDRIVACVGAFLGIAVTGLISRWILGADDPASALMVASMGASTVLLFVVPASPLCQPWPVVGGHLVSAVVGVAVAHMVPDAMVGGAVAVAGAIALMSMLGCLHPPGGGTALIPVLAGLGAPAAEWLFPLAPVGLNAVLLLATAWAFHRVSGHAYPHVAPATATVRAPAITDADIDHALSQMHETLDVSRADLKALTTLAADHAADRSR